VPGHGRRVGNVIVPCTLVDGCQRAVIWYAAGGSQELDTLGGADSVANDINASGEVVGMSTSPQVGNTAFFWSASRGMVQLPFRGRFAVANALSDVRPDGTRVVVGTNSKAEAIVWVVNP
jgi:probable HAF family extracellular repeat protein